MLCPWIRAALALPAALAVSAVPAGAGMTSRYTDFDLAACEERLVQEEGGHYEFDCPGLDGIGVFLTEGDLRQDIDFGVRNAVFDSFGGFNNVGLRVEWRLDAAGKLFATITRFLIDGYDEAGEPAKAEVLAVNTIGTASAPGCTVGYVDARANEDANVLARRLADERAADFRCGADKPSYLGKVGSLASQTMSMTVR